DAFRQGLRELGYVEGRNIVIEYRSAEGRNDRLPELAAELVRLKVDVLVTTGPAAVGAGKQATSTIPIVMGAVGDAVDFGFVASLARPGGNITGMSWLGPELNAKRLELLKEVFPQSRPCGCPLGSSDPEDLCESNRSRRPILGDKSQGPGGCKI